MKFHFCFTSKGRLIIVVKKADSYDHLLVVHVSTTYGLSHPKVNITFEL